MTGNQPQRDTIEDYVLLNAPQSAKEKPICQTLCSLFVIGFAIAALATDELSDGDIDIDDTTSEEDIDFDCGWKHVLFTFSEIERQSNDGVIYDDIEDYSKQYNFDAKLFLNNGLSKKQERRSLLQRNNNNGPLQPGDDGTETLKYTSNELCDELDEFDSDWCTDMQTAGAVWLAFGILSIVSSVAAIVSIWKVKNKGSKCYLFWQFFSILCIVISTMYWMSEGRCDEFEDLEPVSASLEVSIGSSMTLMFVALGFGIMALLQSCFYVCKTNKNDLGFEYSLDLKQKAGLANDNEKEMANNMNSNNHVDIASNNVTVAKIGGGSVQYDHVADDENDDDDDA